MPVQDPSEEMWRLQIRSRLLNEYERNLATYLRVEHAAKTILEYELLPLRLKAAASYERIEVLSRIKSFGSAFEKIWGGLGAEQGKTELASPVGPIAASLDRNRDMVGLKVRAFPNELLSEVEKIVVTIFQPKPKDADHNEAIGMKKFFVRLPEPCPPDLRDFMFEVQIKPYLIDAYHDIEHGLIYKSRFPALRRLMEGWDEQVVTVLKNFANEFEKIEREVLPHLPDANIGGI